MLVGEILGSLMSKPFLLEVGLELTSPFSFVKTATAETSSEIITSPCRRESKDLCRLFYVANSAVDAFRGVLYHRAFFTLLWLGPRFIGPHGGRQCSGLVMMAKPEQ